MHGADLPHWEQDDVLQFVTFRLKDSLPQSKLRMWKIQRETWLNLHPQPWDEATQATYHREFTVPFEHWLDQGYGHCLLKDAKNRKTLEDVLHHDHGTRAEFITWVIMPNHVHLLFRPRYPLHELIKSWKGISARRIGLGPIWQRNYRDTLLRNGRHYTTVVRYIRKNPAKLPEGSYSLWESEQAKEV